MGKWTEVAKRYPAQAKEPGVWRELVNKIKDAAKAKMDVLSADPVALKNAIRKARAEKDAAEEALSKVNAKVSALEELIAENAAATERDIPYHFSDGARIEVSDAISVQCADNDAVLAWVRARGLERLLTVNPARLASITKEGLENGTEIPDGVAISSYKQVKFVAPRKAK